MYQERTFKKISGYNDLPQLYYANETLAELEKKQGIYFNPTERQLINKAIEERTEAMNEVLNYVKGFLGKYVSMWFYNKDNGTTKRFKKICGLLYYYNDSNRLFFGVFTETDYAGDYVTSRFFDGTIDLEYLMKNYDTDISEITKNDFITFSKNAIENTLKTRINKNDKRVLTENGYEYPDRCTQMSTEEEF